MTDHDPYAAAPAGSSGGPPGTAGGTPDGVAATLDRVRAEVRKAVVGQDDVVSGLLVALLVRGHVLLEGVPGTAKTLLVKSLAGALDLDGARVQFTPDLMPSDVTGQTVFYQETGEFRFRAGPVFTNLLLADEVNRTPPKTQSALLEAMEERQVTVEGQARPLPDPFLVVATQNPIEYEGTYPLPEAQLDRFLFKLAVDYPTLDQERDVLLRHHRGLDPHDLASAGVGAVANVDDLATARRAVHGVEVEERVVGYVADLARATRTAAPVSLGASPRGATMLLHAAKAWALMSGRGFVTPDDVKAVAVPTLRHRVKLRPEVELDGTTADGVLTALLERTEVPR